jgi:HK97 family phage prohead protease
VETRATDTAPHPTNQQPAGKTNPLEASTSPVPAGRSATIEFIASTAALDRYGEIISPEGWRLENYRHNPVFQNAHQYGDIIFTLGKALTTEVRHVGGRLALCQTIEFAVEANPMARIAYALYQGKFLNAVSVGFVPIRWENGAADSEFRRRYVEQELLEVSAVGIPANPEALQLGLKSGVVEKSDLQSLLTLLEHTINPSLHPSDASAVYQSLSEFCSIAAAPNPHSRAQGVRNNGAQLLQLARALRDLLRRC